MSGNGTTSFENDYQDNSQDWFYEEEFGHQCSDAGNADFGTSLNVPVDDTPLTPPQQVACGPHVTEATGMGQVGQHDAPVYQDQLADLEDIMPSTSYYPMQTDQTAEYPMQHMQQASGTMEYVPQQTADYGIAETHQTSEYAMNNTGGQQMVATDYGMAPGTSDQSQQQQQQFDNLQAYQRNQSYQDGTMETTYESMPMDYMSDGATTSNTMPLECSISHDYSQDQQYQQMNVSGQQWGQMPPDQGMSSQQDTMIIYSSSQPMSQQQMSNDTGSIQTPSLQMLSSYNPQQNQQQQQQQQPQIITTVPNGKSILTNLQPVQTMHTQSQQYEMASSAFPNQQMTYVDQQNGPQQFISQGSGMYHQPVMQVIHNGPQPVHMQQPQSAPLQQMPTQPEPPKSRARRQPKAQARRKAQPTPESAGSRIESLVSKFAGSVVVHFTPEKAMKMMNISAEVERLQELEKKGIDVTDEMRRYENELDELLQNADIAPKPVPPPPPPPQRPIQPMPPPNKPAARKKTAAQSKRNNVAPAPPVSTVQNVPIQPVPVPQTNNVNYQVVEQNGASIILESSNGQRVRALCVSSINGTATYQLQGPDPIAQVNNRPYDVSSQPFTITTTQAQYDASQSAVNDVVDSFEPKGNRATPKKQPAKPRARRSNVSQERKERQEQQRIAEEQQRRQQQMALQQQQQQHEQQLLVQQQLQKQQSAAVKPGQQKGVFKEPASIVCIPSTSSNTKIILPSINEGRIRVVSSREKRRKGVADFVAKYKNAMASMDVNSAFTSRTDILDRLLPYAFHYEPDFTEKAVDKADHDLHRRRVYLEHSVKNVANKMKKILFKDLSTPFHSHEQALLYAIDLDYEKQLFDKEKALAKENLEKFVAESDIINAKISQTDLDAKKKAFETRIRPLTHRLPSFEPSHFNEQQVLERARALVESLKPKPPPASPVVALSSASVRPATATPSPPLSRATPTQLPVAAQPALQSTPPPKSAAQTVQRLKSPSPIRRVSAPPQENKKVYKSKETISSESESESDDEVRAKPTAPLKLYSVERNSQSPDLLFKRPPDVIRVRRPFDFQRKPSPLAKDSTSKITLKITKPLQDGAVASVSTSSPKLKHRSESSHTSLKRSAEPPLFKPPSPPKMPKTSSDRFAAPKLDKGKKKHDHVRPRNVSEPRKSSSPARSSVSPFKMPSLPPTHLKRPSPSPVAAPSSVAPSMSPAKGATPVEKTPSVAATFKSPATIPQFKIPVPQASTSRSSPAPPSATSASSATQSVAPLKIKLSGGLLCNGEKKREERLSAPAESSKHSTKSTQPPVESSKPQQPIKIVIKPMPPKPADPVVPSLTIKRDVILSEEERHKAEKKKRKEEKKAKKLLEAKIKHEVTTNHHHHHAKAESTEEEERKRRKEEKHRRKQEKKRSKSEKRSQGQHRDTKPNVVAPEVSSPAPAAEINHPKLVLRIPRRSDIVNGKREPEPEVPPSQDIRPPPIKITIPRKSKPVALPASAPAPAPASAPAPLLPPPSKHSPLPASAKHTHHPTNHVCQQPIAPIKLRIRLGHDSSTKNSASPSSVTTPTPAAGRLPSQNQPVNSIAANTASKSNGHVPSRPAVSSSNKDIDFDFSDCEEDTTTSELQNRTMRVLSQIAHADQA